MTTPPMNPRPVSGRAADAIASGFTPTLRSASPATPAQRRMPARPGCA
ncbi:hypothetical protein [Streptomyces sp. SP17KL33]|nr:hypothetical protein [Streptomyces sp. SP17KL33]MEE1829411.1 hypothetical protein [Streptomyces sp. SP17KL33]